MRGAIHGAIGDEEKRIRKVLKTQNKYSTIPSNRFTLYWSL